VSSDGGGVNVGGGMTFRVIPDARCGRLSCVIPASLIDVDGGLPIWKLREFLKTNCKLDPIFLLERHSKAVLDWNESKNLLRF
jgi:hypothetical protein